MALSFDVSNAAGLGKLNEYLASRSYITGCVAACQKSSATVAGSCAAPAVWAAPRRCAAARRQAGASAWRDARYVRLPRLAARARRRLRNPRCGGRRAEPFWRRPAARRYQASRDDLAVYVAFGAAPAAASAPHAARWYSHISALLGSR